MNQPLPLPLRIAAGLVASAVEQVLDLPRALAELPITAVSQTLQASMRVQQRVTELAIKGDRALSVLRPVEEKPSWATFDDEDELPASPTRPGSNGAVVTPIRPADAMAQVAAASFAEPRIDAVEDLDDVEDAEALALIEDAEATEGGITEMAVAAVAGLPIPDYPTMSIAQLRGRLRYLSTADLEQLLAFETANENRPSYVTMLNNRITTVNEGS